MTVEEISIRISASAEQAMAQLDRVAGKVSDLAGAKPFRLQLDTAQAEERLAALAKSANQLLTDLHGNQTTAAALAGAQHSYKSAIRELQALKTLSRTTYEQELSYLQTLQEGMGRYGLQAKDALDLEKRLLAVQESIARRDAASLDTLLGGVIDALAARYETMRDAELAMLAQSRDAWRSWQDGSRDAIQSQIDALDALSQAEDRAAQEQEHLRGIEKLTQALSYEQNEFNLAQLSTQLREAQTAYAAWQADIAREDEKEALRAQLLTIDERTQAELAALDTQADAINAAYGQRLQAAALQAEAEQQVMAGSQQELLSLIAQFAPQYNAAGQTLGEQLLAGFTQRAGNIAGWMETLNGMILAVQRSLGESMQAAAEGFYPAHGAAGVTITQQNTFNTPVESPAETAWRIQQANEVLAAQLLDS